MLLDQLRQVGGRSPAFDLQKQDPDRLARGHPRLKFLAMGRHKGVGLLDDHEPLFREEGERSQFVENVGETGGVPLKPRDRQVVGLGKDELADRRGRLAPQVEIIAVKDVDPLDRHLRRIFQEVDRQHDSNHHWLRTSASRLQFNIDPDRDNRGTTLADSTR